MEMEIGEEWRVLVYIHDLRSNAITPTTYASFENAKRACERLNAFNPLTHVYTPIKVRLMANLPEKKA